ncbi:hypothetical protein [Blastopirellula retiformator]|uniref:Zinc-finger domain-containing protein n=1 Tax=Blastopirellula retiformator TaxID=2527970 RepID=A0A5C5V6H3_9BACT|nr:hypothetical protein [Blastopirellula retiformator]TWT33362.1 hypothetical protein Enr8_31890 [Blastopirellula retiformator]
MNSRSNTLRLATCDEVFEILTRAPFPTGDAEVDDSVERHLHCCHDCRRLAEALGPATSQLAETLPAEADQLPQVDGDFWRNAEVNWTNQSVGATPDRSPLLNIAIPVAAVLTALLVAITFWGSQTTPPRGSVPSLANVKLDAQRYLANLSLPAACQPNPGSRSPEMVVQAVATLPSPALADLTCCSKCHHPSTDADSQPAHSSATKSSPAAIAAVTNSCLACHAQ